MGGTRIALATIRARSGLLVHPTFASGRWFQSALASTDLLGGFLRLSGETSSGVRCADRRISAATGPPASVQRLERRGDMQGKQSVKAQGSLLWRSWRDRTSKYFPKYLHASVGVKIVPEQ